MLVNERAHTAADRANLQDRNDHLARAQAAMAAGERAGAYAGQLEGDDGLGEEGDDPADGADEAGAALARPVHGLGKVQAEDEAGEGLGQDIDDVAARHLLEVGVVLALGSGLHLHLVGLDALLAGEAGDGLRRRGFRRTEDAFHGIWLAGREAFGAEDEAPRGGIEADGFVGDVQFLKGHAQVFERRGNHPIGDFLGADFQQEGEVRLAAGFLALGLGQLVQGMGGGHWATSTTACCWSLQAAATATAILRTR